MLTIWGRMNSINVQKPVLLAEEIGLPYVLAPAGMEFGVVNTAEYRARNPNGLVPTIDDDGFVLWESNAIVRYLAAKYSPGGLWADDPRARADADRWIDWQTTTFYPKYALAFAQMVRGKPEARDPAAIEASRSAGDAAAGVLDAHLAGSEWIDGRGYSMAEAVLAPTIHRWLNFPVARTKRPHLERWYRAVMARPATARVLTLPVT